jgi:hypothetical protein
LVTGSRRQTGGVDPLLDCGELLRRRTADVVEPHNPLLQVRFQQSGGVEHTPVFQHFQLKSSHTPSRCRRCSSLVEGGNPHGSTRHCRNGLRYNKNSRVVGAQTVRRDQAEAGEGLACRRNLTGRFCFDVSSSASAPEETSFAV